MKKEGAWAGARRRGGQARGWAAPQLERHARAQPARQPTGHPDSTRSHLGLSLALAHPSARPPLLLLAVPPPPPRAARQPGAGGGLAAAAPQHRHLPGGPAGVAHPQLPRGAPRRADDADDDDCAVLRCAALRWAVLALRCAAQRLVQRAAAQSLCMCGGWESQVPAGLPAPSPQPGSAAPPLRRCYSASAHCCCRRAALQAPADETLHLSYHDGALLLGSHGGQARQRSTLGSASPAARPMCSPPLPPLYLTPPLSRHALQLCPPG